MTGGLLGLTVLLLVTTGLVIGKPPPARLRAAYRS
jgi:hypothetical protein